MVWVDVYHMRRKIEQKFPLDWNSPCRGEEASHHEISTQVRQLNVAAKVVRPTDLLNNVKYIIDYNNERPSLVKAPLSV